MGGWVLVFAVLVVLVEVVVVGDEGAVVRGCVGLHAGSKRLTNRTGITA